MLGMGGPSGAQGRGERVQPPDSLEEKTVFKSGGAQTEAVKPSPCRQEAGEAALG